MPDYKKKRLALIVTVFNEEKSINILLESYQQQSLHADEAIFVDAQSQDKTPQILTDFAEKHPELHIRVFSRPSNRSQGRNFAVRQTEADFLAISDAGCLLDENWLFSLVKKQREESNLVVAGPTFGLITTPLQEAIIPYFLLMPDKINEKTYLPATRSMLISRQLWLQMGGLNEELLVSEDYQFSQRLKKAKVAMSFAADAKVYWLAPDSFRGFINKIWQFAQGDVQAKLLRGKVLFLFFRYFLAASIIFLFFLFPSTLFFYLLIFSFFTYLFWAILKNVRYCPRSWFYLPILQLLADFTVMTATLNALFKRKKGQ